MTSDGGLPVRMWISISSRIDIKARLGATRALQLSVGQIRFPNLVPSIWYNKNLTVFFQREYYFYPLPGYVQEETYFYGKYIFIREILVHVPLQNENY